MDWYPLYNPAAYRAHFHGYHLLRGDCGGYYVARLPRVLKACWMCCSRCRSLLPPAVVGYLLLRVLGPKKEPSAHGRSRILISS